MQFEQVLAWHFSLQVQVQNLFLFKRYRIANGFYSVVLPQHVAFQKLNQSVTGTRTQLASVLTPLDRRIPRPRTAGEKNGF